MQHVDFTVIALVWVAGSALMLPLLAFAARYGLAPVIESVAELRSAGRTPARVERRLAAIERALAELSARAGNGGDTPGASTVQRG